MADSHTPTCVPLYPAPLRKMKTPCERKGMVVFIATLPVTALKYVNNGFHTLSSSAELFMKLLYLKAFPVLSTTLFHQVKGTYVTRMEPHIDHTMRKRLQENAAGPPPPNRPRSFEVGGARCRTQTKQEKRNPFRYDVMYGDP